MVRRRSPQPADLTIPQGWTRHAGGPRPIGGSPAVMFRSGTRTKPGGFPATHWERFDSCCWSWNGREEDGFDIVAFKPEPDELIAIPRLR